MIRCVVCDRLSDHAPGCSQRCPACDADLRCLPAWGMFDAVFALRGVVWKIVGLGASCNRHYNPFRHFCHENVVVVAPVRSDELSLPKKGRPVEELVSWAQRQRDAQQFFVDELEKAIRISIG